MTDFTKLLNLIIESSGIVLCAMAIFLILAGPQIDQKIRRYFLCYFGGCISLSLANITGLLLRGLPGHTWRTVLYISNFTEFLIPGFLQVIQYGINFTIFSTIIAGLSMYVFIVRDQTEQYEQKQRENARQRASILVLEMRPHFIYNTMMSIYYLCAQDAKKAQQVTLDFTEYLRRAFTAINREDTIPFTEELEHTRAYLAVEKARFEDQLYVEFDTPCTVFRIPPLTLQPIVENSIKHGLSPELGPLYISVTTDETDNGCEIIVEDNGPGLTAPEGDEPHIALANIRERLQMMCEGTLSIEQGETGGTKVIVRVPWTK